MDDPDKATCRPSLWSIACIFHKTLIQPALLKGKKFLSAASNEFFASVENHLYGLGVSTQMSADELDMVNDFALQGFGAVACAEHIEKQRTQKCCRADLHW